jgi:hypothetical protein
MKKLLIYAVPIALMAARAVATPPAGWGGMATLDLGAATAGNEHAPLVLVGYRGGGGGAHINRANVNRANINRTNVNRTSFNSNSFHRDVSVNRNVNVNRNVPSTAAITAATMGRTGVA